jgi:hypothetical protein
MVLNHTSTGQVLVRSARRKDMKDIVAAMNASVGFCTQRIWRWGEGGGDAGGRYGKGVSVRNSR